jgi:hypothetical protein
MSVFDKLRSWWNKDDAAEGQTPEERTEAEMQAQAIKRETEIQGGVSASGSADWERDSERPH